MLGCLAFIWDPCTDRDEGQSPICRRQSTKQPADPRQKLKAPSVGRSRLNNQLTPDRSSTPSPRGRFQKLIQHPQDKKGKHEFLVLTLVRVDIQSWAAHVHWCSTRSAFQSIQTVGPSLKLRSHVTSTIPKLGLMLYGAAYQR